MTARTAATLSERTTGLRAAGRKALVPFLTAGYPDDPTFLDLVACAVDAGCEVIEIGLPFSDPMADGPVIQAASQQALAGGVTPAHTLDLIARAGASLTARGVVAPAFVVMSYFNPILQQGLAAFAAAAAAAGVRGVILPDVPLEESHEARAALGEVDLELVDLVAPTSGPERIAAIGREARGFLYLVSLTGVTGARSDLAQGLEAFIDRVRPGTSVPLYVGFGVSTPAQAARIAGPADGVIIGSALIRIVQQAHGRHAAVERVGAFLREVQVALGARPAGGES